MSSSIPASYRAPPDGRPGRQAVNSDAAIPFCLTIKVFFKLPLRQTAGMVASLLKMARRSFAFAAEVSSCAMTLSIRRSRSPIWVYGIAVGLQDAAKALQYPHGMLPAPTVAKTTRIDLRLVDVPAPRPGDRLEIDGEAFLIQGELVRGRERLGASSRRGS